MFRRDRFYRPQEIWRESHAPRALIYAALANGELPAIRRGSRYLVPGIAVLAWLGVKQGGDRHDD